MRARLDNGSGADVNGVVRRDTGAYIRVHSKPPAICACALHRRSHRCAVPPSFSDGSVAPLTADQKGIDDDLARRPPHTA